jgi:DNA-binding NtrC family response regulator
MARLIFVEGPWKGVEIGLEGREYTLGRDPTCEIAIPDKALSRRHARIEPADGGWAASDLGSRNGTSLNGAALTRAALREGDRLAVGRHAIVFTSRDAAVDLGDTTTIVADLGAARDDLALLQALNQALAGAPDGEHATDAAARWLLRRTGGARAVVYRRRGSGLIAERAVTERTAGAPGTEPVPTAALLDAARHGNATWMGRGGRGAAIVPAGAGAEVAFAIPEVEPLSGEVLRVLTLAAHLCAAQLASRFRIETLASRLDEVAGTEQRLVASSPAMLPVLEFIERAAQSDSTVIVLGESGTGKELVARALHRNGHRRDGPFVGINCAAIPAGVLEAELFGHERGAFTGAEARRAGCFEAADGGTLLLDEVGELSQQAQAGLLRVLEERVVQRVGGSRPVPVDVRIVAATHRDLGAAVAAGTFREDLFFRLSVLVASLPPLRDRPEDIEPLTRAFVERLAARVPRRIAGVSPEALACLRAHPWPGNIRELRNAIERAIMLGRGEQIELGDLPPDIRAGGASVPAAAGPGPTDRADLPMPSAELDRRNLLAALAATKGNKTRAAALLGIDRVTLYNRLKALDKPPG